MVVALSCSSPKEKVNPKVLDLSPEQVSQWSDDIDFFQSELEKRHIHLYHKLSKQDFESDLSALKDALPNHNAHEVMVELMRIARGIGDGHTLYAFWSKAYSRFPIQLMSFDDELRVVKTTQEHRHLLGKKLRGVDGTPIAEVIQRVSPVVQGVDNKHSLAHSLPSTIHVAEVLFGLKITDQLHTAKFEFSDDFGNNESVVLHAVGHEAFNGLMTEGLRSESQPLGKPLKSTDGLWLSADLPTQTAYIRFDHYPGFGKMLLFANGVKKQLEKHEIKYLIIDFRGNGGGNFFEGLVLAQMLVTVDGLEWRDGVYALIGKKTFSAGVSNAAQFKQILNAQWVGEPTGGNPYGYQDADRFELPHAGVTIQYSKRLFSMQDQSTEGLIPDVRIETTWTDYQQNRDPQLEWILADIANKR